MAMLLTIDNPQIIPKYTSLDKNNLWIFVDTCGKMWIYTDTDTKGDWGKAHAFGRSDSNPQNLLFRIFRTSEVFPGR